MFDNWYLRDLILIVKRYSEEKGLRVQGPVSLNDTTGHSTLNLPYTIDRPLATKQSVVDLRPCEIRLAVSLDCSEAEAGSR